MGAKKVIYLDCFSGISGDMFLGALLDAGLSLSHLNEGLSTLPINGFYLKAEKVSCYGITATNFQVLTENGESFRNMESIRHIVEESELPADVKKTSLNVFSKLAAVEARLHGVPEEDVHFHEIGALDSIVDIIGSVLALHLLEVEEVLCSPLPQGRGMIEVEHGKIPLPAPAAVELLAERKAPVYGVDLKGELVTPTGAALIYELVSDFGQLPSYNLLSVGYGAGSKDYGVPNYLRVLLGTQENNQSFSYQEKVDVIEANIDDLNPEITGFLMDKMLEQGALDVSFAPVQMKKNRPAVKITLLSPVEKTRALVEHLFRETSTFGCRVIEARKVMLPRQFAEINTSWGKVRVKMVAVEEENEAWHYSPEYEDCLAIARREGIPLQEVYREVDYLFRHSKKNHL